MSSKRIKDVCKEIEKEFGHTINPVDLYNLISKSPCKKEILKL